MPWTGNPATWIANSLLTASQLNLELRDRMVVLRAGGFALSGQAAGNYMKATSATQWEVTGGMMTSHQFTATFAAVGGAQDIDVDITSVGLTGITKGAVILQSAPLSEGAVVSAYLTSATNARVSSDATVNAVTVRFTVLKLE